MATASLRIKKHVDYPTSDGKPMAETDIHRDLMFDLIKTLQAYYARHPMVYVSGNLLLYYVQGDKRRHVSPDVFVVFGVPQKRRLYYLLWEESKGPDLVIELTSKSTKKEDLETKLRLYQDVLKVREYFLFDPQGEYLKPPMKGYQLLNGRYVPIKAVQGRLPSAVLGLHLERADSALRLYDPETGRWLPTLQEAWQEEALARQEEASARQQAEAEAQRLRSELEELRRQSGR